MIYLVGIIKLFLALLVKPIVNFTNDHGERQDHFMISCLSFRSEKSEKLKKVLTVDRPINVFNDDFLWPSFLTNFDSVTDFDGIELHPIFYQTLMDFNGNQPFRSNTYQTWIKLWYKCQRKTLRNFDQVILSKFDNVNAKLCPSFPCQRKLGQKFLIVSMHNLVQVFFVKENLDQVFLLNFDSVKPP